MWVKLLRPHIIEVNGVPTKKYAGDWLEVGKQTALLWINQGLAEKPNDNAIKEYIDSTAGVIVTNQVDATKIRSITKDLNSIPFNILLEPQLLYSENMIYDGHSKIQRNLLPIGFKLLKKWQVAAPLLSYEVLACHLGSEDERNYTKSIIRDLRVPVYNTGLMFLRRDNETQKLIEVWNTEKAKFDNPHLAFQRAFYLVKPTLWSLPVSWVG